MSSFVSPNPGDVVRAAHIGQFAHTLGGGQTSAIPLQATGFDSTVYPSLKVRNKSNDTVALHFEVAHSTNSTWLLRVSNAGVHFGAGASTAPTVNFGSTKVGFFQSQATSNEAVMSVGSSGAEMMRFGTFWLSSGAGNPEGSSVNTNYGLIIGPNPVPNIHDRYNFAILTGKDNDDPDTGKNKLIVRSLIAGEYNDAVDIARRRAQGSLTNPVALDYTLAGGSSASVDGQPAGSTDLTNPLNVNNRIIARDYAQGWDGTSWAASQEQGWHASINWHIQQTPTQLNRGGGIAFAVTKNNPGHGGTTAAGYQVPRERMWINHLGQIVISGRAAVELNAAPWGEESSFLSGISMDNYNPQAWLTLIATREGNTTYTTDSWKNLLALRHYRQENDGINLRITSTGLGHLSFYRCAGAGTDTNSLPLDLSFSSGTGAAVGVGGRAALGARLTVYGAAAIQQHAVRVRRETATVIEHNTLTAVGFSTAAFQTNSSMWSSATSSGQRLVAQMPGLYQITGNVFWNTNSSGTRSLRVLKNGSSIIGLSAIPPVAASQTAQVVTTLYRLSSGDYVELLAYQDSGSSISIAAQANYSPSFTMAYVGST